MKKFAVSYTRPGMQQEKTEVFSGKSAADVIARLRKEQPAWKLYKITEKGKYQR